MSKIPKPPDFPGVEMEAPSSVREELDGLISDAVRTATALTPDTTLVQEVGPETVSVNLAALAATQTVTALLSTAAVKCHLDSPPEDVEMKLDSSRKLVYRCYHHPPHEWDLNGNPIT